MLVFRRRQRECGERDGACQKNHFRRKHAWFLAAGAAAIIALSPLKTDAQARDSTLCIDSAQLDKRLHPFFRIGKNSRKGNYEICGLGSSKYGLQLVFSVWEPDRLPTLREVYKALGKYLNTGKGQEAYCDYLQEKLDSLYAKFGLDGNALQLDSNMRETVKSRLNGISIRQAWFVHLDGRTHAVTLPGARSYHIYIAPTMDSANAYSPFQPVGHEILHVVSGLDPAKGIGGALRRGWSVYDGIVESVGNQKYYGSARWAHRNPGPALEEAMTELVSWDTATTYQNLTLPVENGLMELVPKKRKENLDCLVLSWLNFASKQQYGESKAFLIYAIKKYGKE